MDGPRLCGTGHRRPWTPSKSDRRVKLRVDVVHNCIQTAYRRTCAYRIRGIHALSLDDGFTKVSSFKLHVSRVACALPRSRTNPTLPNPNPNPYPNPWILAGGRRHPPPLSQPRPHPPETAPSPQAQVLPLSTPPGTVVRAPTPGPNPTPSPARPCQNPCRDRGDPHRVRPA